MIFVASPGESTDQIPTTGPKIYDMDILIPASTLAKIVGS